MADWPLISDLGPLGALPTVPRLARGFVSVTLNGWGLDISVAPEPSAFALAGLGGFILLAFRRRP